MENSRYFVQGETIRGEPRVYFVSDRKGKYYASEVTTDQRQAQRWCNKMNAALLAEKKTEPS